MEWSIQQPVFSGTFQTVKSVTYLELNLLSLSVMTLFRSSFGILFPNYPAHPLSTTLG